MAMRSRTNFTLDERTEARLRVLAEANFPQRVRAGNQSALIRHLIDKAWANPDKFGLEKPTALTEDVAALVEGGPKKKAS